MKEFERSVDIDINLTFSLTVCIARRKYETHPNINIITENVLSESQFRFRDVGKNDIQQDTLNCVPKKKKKQLYLVIFVLRY